jgi:L-fuculose-phosphate aldolase
MGERECKMSIMFKKQICEVAKMMYDRRMVNTFEGNISIKANSRIYITPSATCKGYLTEESIIVTDMYGNVIEGTGKPSSEIKLHIAAYGFRENISSIVHAHTPYATAYAIANKPIETKAYPELIAVFGKVPLAKYGTPSTDDIYQGIEEYINEYDNILLANHGIMSVGKDALDAFYKLEAVESIAKTLTIAKMHGGEKELPVDELEKLNLMRVKK